MLLQQVLPTMRSAIRSLLGASADAEDALQQAAIDVLCGLHTFRGEANLTAWTRTVAVRAGLRTAHQCRRHLSVADPQAMQPVVRIEDEPLGDRIPRALSHYLQALTAAQREALVLRHGLGYTVPEIAELLDTSVNTVKSRLLQARRELRKLIRRDEAVGRMPRPSGGALREAP